MLTWRKVRYTHIIGHASSHEVSRMIRSSMRFVAVFLGVEHE